MSKLFKERCTQLHLDVMAMRYPNVPKYGLVPLILNGKGTNLLTSRIITFIQLNGWQAERINNTGMARVSKLQLASGYESKSVTWTKGTGTKGTADISATINGKSVKIEVKNAKTKDRMSEAQKKYKEQVELTGGVYYIAKDIDSFINWFDENFTINDKWQQAVLKVYRK